MDSKRNGGGLDPEIAVVLDSIKGMMPMEMMSVEELRASLAPTPLKHRQSVASIDDRIIDGSIPVRIYRPNASRCDSLLIYFHGGGFVIGSIETHDQVSRLLCDYVGCTVVAVDYRLAPEHRFPAATDDCLTAVRWAAAHAEDLAASDRKIVVIGDSAGANLAAVTTLRLRDEGGAQVSGQILAYPVTDYHSPPTHSYIENASGFSLTRSAMIRFWHDYLPDNADAYHPHVSPLRAPSLSRLPPALVFTAEFDPLRDEGNAYAARLQQHAVPVTLIQLKGMIHGFLRMAGASLQARLAFSQIADWTHSVARS